MDVIPAALGLVLVTMCPCYPDTTSFCPKSSVQIFLDIECLEFLEASSPRKQQLYQHLPISPLLYLGRPRM